MKNILLCNNSMGIGGVETVILNQVTAFTKKGYNVYVVAGKGIYSDKIEELGGNFIELEFTEGNTINVDRINKLVQTIKEKQITEIHIHKYQCIPTAMPAALISGIPYFAYEHGIRDTRKYYTWNYPIYKKLFPIYFKNAYKIIAITPKVAEFTQKEYNIEKSKYEIVHNGIDFNIYNNENPNYEGEIKKAVIISRFYNEKINTILEGIEIFSKLLETYPTAKLEIVGGGEEKEKIDKYLQELQIDYANNKEEATVNFIGEQNNIIAYLQDADLLLGVDRCALEGIAMKVPVVITGYSGIKGLITEKNINLSAEENFSGDNMETISLEECINQVLQLKEKRQEIVEYNYNFATEKLNCFKNYINVEDKGNNKVEWIDIFKDIEESTNTIEEQSKDIKAKYEWIQKIEKENENLENKNRKLQDKLNKVEEANEDLKKELKDIYSSKRWKYTEKLSKIIHRGK